MHSLSEPLLKEYKTTESRQYELYYQVMFHFFVMLAIITLMLNMTLFNLDYVQVYIYVTWPLFTLVSFVCFYHGFEKHDILQEIVTVIMITTMLIWFLENSKDYIAIEIVLLVCLLFTYSTFEVSREMVNFKLYFGVMHWAILVICLCPSFFIGDYFFRTI